MEKKFADIINEGKKSSKTMSEINTELKMAGATFHLDYTMCENGPVTGWSETEMAEGFQVGKEEAHVVHLADLLGRDTAKAGLTVRTVTAEGIYDITYDEGGYAGKAVRV